MIARAPRRGEAGFTLIELVIAMTIVAMWAAFVTQTLWKAVDTRDAIIRELEPPKVEDAILDMVARDLRFLYYRAGLLPQNAGFWGRSKNLPGRGDADRVDFITARTSRIAILEDTMTGQQPGDSPLTEVGYACRPSDVNSKWLELWRREDYFVDDDPTDGGRFSLIYDKVRKFSLRYFPTPDDPTTKATDTGLEVWDSKTTTKAPYAIILELWYDVREPVLDEPQAKVTKIFLLTTGRSLPLESASMTTTPGM